MIRFEEIVGWLIEYEKDKYPRAVLKNTSGRRSKLWHVHSRRTTQFTWGERKHPEEKGLPAWKASYILRQ